jgi:D-3-phosphoglycerate dehydrogenase / 2-oxoglutarate reductase
MISGYDVTLVNTHIENIDKKIRAFNNPEILVLNRTRTIVNEKLLNGLPNLRLISQTGKNDGHIDIAACTQLGIAVAESKGNPIATAELTWALIMDGLRRVSTSIQGMKSGHWQTTLGERIYGKTIGIWGYGKIGKRIATYAKAFEAQTLVWGSEASISRAQEDGHQVAQTKEEFFAMSDVVTLHLRLNELTKHIVKLDDLLLMKPDALIVNTARFQLFEPDALITALRQGRPGYAALDVYDAEPIFDRDHSFLTMDNVICTPHMGYVERQGYELYFGQAFANIIAFLNGDLTNIANPEALRKMS